MATATLADRAIRNYTAVTRSTVLRRRKKWLEALRSGEFKQAKSMLKKKSKGEFRHCCLGVAMELCGVPSAEHEVLGSGVVAYRFESGETSHLDPAGQEWLGVTRSDPYLNLPSGPRTVAELNDRGWSFKQIADAIEEHGFLPESDILTPEGREYALS